MQGADQKYLHCLPFFGAPPVRLKTLRTLAFTLIELLVVIAIVSVLAALLMPALSKAQDRSRTAVCASNLRQIGVATTGYVSDYNGFLPAHTGSTTVPYSPVWMVVLRPYINKQYFCADVGGSSGGMGSPQVTRNVAMCPAYDSHAISLNGAGAPWRAQVWTYTTYGMNVHLDSGRFVITNVSTGAGGWQYVPWKLSTIQRPSQCFLYLETSYNDCSAFDDLYYNPRHSRRVADFGAVTFYNTLPAQFPLGIGASAASLRVDGHFEPIPFLPSDVQGGMGQNDRINGLWYGK